jgi:hypothetical protein
MRVAQIFGAVPTTPAACPMVVPGPAHKRAQSLSSAAVGTLSDQFGFLKPTRPADKRQSCHQMPMTRFSILSAIRHKPLLPARQ